MKKQILKSGRGVLCILATAFAFLVSGNLYASTNEPLNNLPETTEVEKVNREHVYDGTIGKYPIRMTINVEAGWGEYYYKSKGPKHTLGLRIYFKGSRLIMEEYNDYGELTGYFEGKYGNVITGTFYATQSGKKYNFKVKCIR